MRKIIIILASIAIGTFNCDNSTDPQPNPLVLQLQPTHVSANGGSDGAIDLTVKGGTKPYQFLWSNGATTEDITNLTADTYSVIVTDAKTDKATDSIIVTQPQIIPFNWVGIPAGEFTYGSNDSNVDINYDFDIMKYEVTNDQYLTYMNEVISQGDITVVSGCVKGYYAGDSQWNAGEYEYYKLDGDVTGYNVKMITWDGSNFSIENGYEDHPVIFVTWFGADAFAKHYGYRLPTEQEWEKASRGNTGYTFPWGDSIDGRNGNYWDSGDPFDNGTTPIGYYNGNMYNDYQTIDSPSPYGIYDIAGNVWEWTDSYFNSSSSHRVARGGSFGSYSIYLYCYERHHYVSTFTDVNVGFRCIKGY